MTDFWDKCIIINTFLILNKYLPVVLSFDIRIMLRYNSKYELILLVVTCLLFKIKINEVLYIKINIFVQMAHRRREIRNIECIKN